MNDKNDKKEKKPTSKSVMIEIERTKKNNAKRTARIAELKKEIVSGNAKIKELEKQYSTLYQAELISKIADVWFKEQKLTDEQIKKFLELSKQVGGRIDKLDMDTIVKAITNIDSTERC